MVKKNFTYKLSVGSKILQFVFGQLWISGELTLQQNNPKAKEFLYVTAEHQYNCVIFKCQESYLSFLFRITNMLLCLCSWMFDCVAEFNEISIDTTENCIHCLHWT